MFLIPGNFFHNVAEQSANRVGVVRYSERWWLDGDGSIPTGNLGVGPMLAFLAPQAESPESAVSDSLRHSIFSLERRAGWHLGGGRAVARRDCEQAFDFVRDCVSKGLPEPSKASATPLGGVALTWRFGRNLVYIEVSHRHGGKLYYQWGGPTDGEKEGLVERADLLARLAPFLDRSKD